MLGDHANMHDLPQPKMMPFAGQPREDFSLSGDSLFDKGLFAKHELDEMLCPGHAAPVHLDIGTTDGYKKAAPLSLDSSMHQCGRPN